MLFFQHQTGFAWSSLLPYCGSLTKFEAGPWNTQCLLGRVIKPGVIWLLQISVQCMSLWGHYVLWANGLATITVLKSVIKVFTSLFLTQWKDRKEKPKFFCSYFFDNFQSPYSIQLNCRKNVLVFNLFWPTFSISAMSGTKAYKCRLTLIII